MIIKRDCPTGDGVLVTLQLPGSIWAESVHLVGDFNDWNRSSHPLARGSSGDWSITLKLDRGRTYQFRYLVNGTHWQNDWNADRYMPNPFGGDNSVLET
jgi:1,4-alpha-glucan branching enzyme